MGKSGDKTIHKSVEKEVVIRRKLEDNGYKIFCRSIRLFRTDGGDCSKIKMKTYVQSLCHHNMEVGET